MSLWLQVLLGAIPITIVFILMVVFKKKSRAQWIISLVAFSLAAGLSVFFVYNDYLGIAQLQNGSVSQTEVTKDDYLAVAYAFMKVGDYDSTEDVLDAYVDYYPSSSSYLAARGRLYALKGDIKAAKGIASVLEETTDDIKSAFSAKELKNLKNCNTDSLTEDERQDIIESVSDSVEDIVSDNDKKYLEVAKASVGVQTLAAESVGYSTDYYSDSDDDGSAPSEDDIKTLLKYKNDKSTEALFSIEVLGETLVNAEVLNGEYKDALEDGFTHKNGENLLIISNLIDCGKIRKKDIEKLEIEEQDEETQKTAEWVKQQMESVEFTPEELAVMEEILSGISPEQDYSDAYGWIESQILYYIAHNEGGDNSKLYLELAKISYIKGDTEIASKYLELALGESGSSEDAGYKGAANSILEIMNDPDNTEARKEIDNHVNTLITESTPYCTRNIEKSADEESEDEESGETYSEEISDEENPTEETFNRYVSDELNKITGSVDIININKDNFPKVEAIVSVNEALAADATEFKNNLNVLDCSTQIEDYTVEKVNYNEVNLILVCDNSGSMDGQKITDLTSALKMFVKNGDSINIGVVPFSSGVIDDNVCVLGSSQSSLLACADKMGASGGTDIASGVNRALEMFGATKDTLNVVVLMSDGNDGAPNESLQLDISAACEDKNISIYSMGLGGDVDSQVLNIYSDIGGGSYMYISDSQSLLTFYDYIYKLCTNRYKITYEAIDTVLVSRSLTVEANQSSASDTKNYRLYDTDDITEELLGDEYSVTIGDAQISGLETRMFYKSSAAQSTHLMGSGFKETDTLTVELAGNLKYSLEAKYKDDKTYDITIPAGVACGYYDVYVTLNGKRAVFQRGLVMSAKNRSIIRFGDYVFTATEVCESDNCIQLGGVVSLNDWLTFRDGLTITGDVEHDSSVKISYSKASTQYNDTSVTKGFAKYLAEHGYYLDLPGVNNMTIYYDKDVSSSSDEYPVDSYYTGESYISLIDFIGLNGAGVSLYPNRLVLNFSEFKANVPLLDKVMKAKDCNLFDFDLEQEEKIIIGNNSVDCKISVKYSHDSDKQYSAKLGNLGIYVKDCGFEIELDTTGGEVHLGAQTDVAFLTDGLGLSLDWKDWKFDGFELCADAKINVNIGNIPATVCDFKVGLNGLSAGSVNDMVTTKAKGSCEIDFANISEVFPGMAKYIKTGLVDGDLAVAKLDDITVEFGLSDLYFGVSAKAVLFNLVELGEVKIQLGNNISYTNSVLKMNDEKVNGFVGNVKVGITTDTENFDLTTTGTVTLALTNKIFGLGIAGDFDFEISWWIFSKASGAHGEVFLGVYQRPDQEWQFVVYAMGQTKNGAQMTPVFWPSDAIDSVDL